MSPLWEVRLMKHNEEGQACLASFTCASMLLSIGAGPCTGVGFFLSGASLWLCFVPEPVRGWSLGERGTGACVQIVL